MNENPMEKEKENDKDAKDKGTEFNKKYSLI